jgi:hypothetical protein
MGVVGLTYVENILGLGGDLVCGKVADGGEVGLVFGTKLKSRRCFLVIVVSFRAFRVEGILLFSDGVHEFPVSFAYDRCGRFMTE